MKYYIVTFPSHTGLVFKLDGEPEDLIQFFHTYPDFIGRNGTTYNLRMYQSFFELTDPGPYDTNRAYEINTEIL